MAYTPATLSLIDSDLGNQSAQVWRYTTAADADATIVGASYFSDGAKKGMKVGDLVDAIATTGPKYKRYQVASLSGDAATVAAPTAIT
ncbi:MAG: hypothetical protein V4673_14540 [Pseudomonadota bacterium]